MTWEPIEMTIANDTETRKEQIYAVASALFSRRGYHSTSVRDIARELDMQGGSLYAHITSKEEVLREIVHRVGAAFHGSVAPIAQSEAPAAERLTRMIRAHVEVVVHNLPHATVFVQEWRQLGGPARAEVIELRDSYEQLFRDVISEGMIEGDFKAGNAKMAGIVILTALNGMPSWFSPDGQMTSAAVAAEFTEVLLQGLLTR